mmetsp:Transcript_41580/g.116036  ORF Transcript_41580/g.116036 Transcript_41580/m.116036 type:complete len:274 (+) Transcript_41580:215-1036(+)
MEAPWDAAEQPDSPLRCERKRERNALRQDARRPSLVVVGHIREVRSAETHVHHAVMVGHAGLGLPRANLPGVLGLVGGAVVQVRPVRGRHGGLGVEEQFLWRDTHGADTSADLRPGVVLGHTIEVSTVPILVWLLAHGDHRVDVVALAWLVPAIDLQVDAQRQVHVHDAQLLAVAARLHHLPAAVGDNLDHGILVLPGVWKTRNNGDVVECRPERGDAEDVLRAVLALQEGAADRDLLHDGEAVGHWSRHVAALDPDGGALHGPVLALGVEAR